MFMRVNPSTTPLNDIIDRWDARTNPAATMAELFDTYPRTNKTLAQHIFSRHTTNNDLRNIKKCLKLLQRLAKHENTDASQLTTLLWMSAAPDLPAYQNSDITKSYLDLVTILARRPDVSKESLANLVSRRMQASSYTEYSLGYAIALTNNHDLLIQYLTLLVNMSNQQKLDAATISQALARPEGYLKNIGEVIASKYHHSAECMLILAELLDHLKPQEIKKLLPYDYSSFKNYRTKERLHNLICQLPVEQRIDACLSALDQHRPLGVLMYLQRGFEECQIESGVLSDCLETLLTTLHERELAQRMMRQVRVYVPHIPQQQPTAPPRSLDHHEQPVTVTAPIYPILPQAPVNVYNRSAPTAAAPTAQTGDLLSFTANNGNQTAAPASHTPRTLRGMFSEPHHAKEKEEEQPMRRSSLG